MADKTIGELKRASVPLDRNGKVAFESSQGDAEYCEIGDLEDVAEAAAKEQAEAAKVYAEEGKAYRDAAAESARDAADVALHPPILKDGSDHWWTWSTEANDYVESDKDAGVSITVSPDTVTGEPGSAAKVENIGTATDPVLKFTLPRGEKGEVTQEELNTALAAKQDKLTFDDVPADSSDNPVKSGGVYSELQKKPNPNLLINHYFVGGGSQQGGAKFPINQQEQTEYTEAGYTIDQWKKLTKRSSKLQLTDKGLRLYSETPGTSDEIILDHYSEIADELVGKTVTLSVLFDSLVSGKLMVESYRGSGDGFAAGVISSPGLWTKTYTFGYVHDEEKKLKRLLRFYGPLSTDTTLDITIKAVKLELGDQQTLAHQENGIWVLNEIPDYATELAKCLRYFVKFGKNAAFGPAVVCQPDYLDFNIPLSAPLRATPTVGGDFIVWGVSDFTFSCVNADASSVRIRARKTNHGIVDVNDSHWLTVATEGWLDANL